jgi:hypothetical protein
MVRGLALSVAFCLSMTGGLVATTATAAHADVCGGRTGSPIHTKAWLGFKVHDGRWLKGRLLQLDPAEKDSSEQIRGACKRRVEAARAEFCRAFVGSWHHPKASIHFKVKHGRHLEGALWQREHSEKDSSEQIRGVCWKHWKHWS